MLTNRCSASTLCVARYSRRWIEARGLPAVQEFRICLPHWRQQCTATEIPPGWEKPGIFSSTTTTTDRDGSALWSVLTSSIVTPHRYESDSRLIVLICHTALKAHTVTLRPPEQQQPHGYWSEQQQPLPCRPATLNVNMQPLLCACWPLDLEVWWGKEQIFSQISRSTDNPPSVRHSSKCPWLSHLSMLHARVCSVLLEACVISYSFLFLSSLEGFKWEIIKWEIQFIKLRWKEQSSLLNCLNPEPFGIRGVSYKEHVPVKNAYMNNYVSNNKCVMN